MDTQLRVERWQKYGHDRLYVSTPNRYRVGWVDVKTGKHHIEGPDPDRQRANAVAQAVQEWQLEQAAANDLTHRAPGAGIAAKADEARAQLRWWHRIGSLIGIQPPGYSWIAGHAGEKAVGRRLERLKARGFLVLHGVALGKGGDIDHLVIGPGGGVWTINTKHHRKKSLTVGHTVLFVGGYRSDHITKAQREAARISEALSAAVGWRVPVSPMIVCHGQRRLNGWLRNRPLGVQVVPMRWAALALRWKNRRSLHTPSQRATLKMTATQATTYHHI